MRQHQLNKHLRAVRGGVVNNYGQSGELLTCDEAGGDYSTFDGNIGATGMNYHVRGVCAADGSVWINGVFHISEVTLSGTLLADAILPDGVTLNMLIMDAQEHGIFIEQ